jgi:hypothetical protein
MTSPPEWSYGTRPKTGAPVVAWIGPELAQATLGDWAEFLGHLIPVVGQAPVDVAELCSAPPDPAWPLTAEELALKLVQPFGMFEIPQRIVDSGKYSIWPTLCEYIPAPDPIAEPEPPPPVYVPPEVPPEVVPPPAPTIPGLDELGVLVSWIYREVGGMRDSWEWTRDLAEFVAKHTSTLTFDFGATFNISGSGSTFLNPADGYMVTLTNVPDYIGRTTGGVPTHFDAGWFGYGPWPLLRRKERLAHHMQLFYPAHFESHVISWELPPGVTATVTALLRERYPRALPRFPIVLGG